MGALITVGVLTVVAIDVTAAIQWATGTRTPTDSITTLLMSVAMVVVATWQATHPHRTHCWPGYPVGACMTAPSALGNNDDGTLPSTDEGEQR